MREHAVVADGDPEGGQQVHGGEDREVGGARRAVPQQHDGGQRRGEGERDGRQVHGLLGSGHARHGMRPASTCSTVSGKVMAAEVIREVTRTEPWRTLPRGVADLVESELPATAEDIMAAIPGEVPEYARPFEGSFGRGVQTGVTEALRQFVALIATRRRTTGARGVRRAGPRGAASRTQVGLAAVRLPGRRARGVAAHRGGGAQAGLDAEALNLLAEAIFAYIDELSADSVEGYAQAQSDARGRASAPARARGGPAPRSCRRGRRRAAAAQAAGWRLPRTVAALACAEADLPRLARRLPPDAITAVVDSAGCALVPDPAGPGRGEEIAVAAGTWSPDSARAQSARRSPPRGRSPGRLCAPPKRAPSPPRGS